MTVSKRALVENQKLTVGDNTIVLSDVKKHVMQKPEDPDRPTNVLHASDMSKQEWCWRHDYYRILGTPVDPKSQNPSFRMSNVFAQGHEIHEKWQRWWWEMGILYGVFQCYLCGYRWWDLSPKECFNCGDDRFLHYKEIPLGAKELHMSGHADGGLMQGDEFRLAEIKSVSLGTLRFEAPHLYEAYLNNESLDKIWMQISRPFASHVRQGSLYLYMATRGANPNVPVPLEMVYIYEWKPTQEVKEFTVKYSPRWVERMLGGAQMVTDALEHHRPPQRPNWAEDEMSRNCRSCPYRRQCWKIPNNEQRDEGDPPKVVPIKRAPAAVRRRALARKA